MKLFSNFLILSFFLKFNFIKLNQTNLNYKTNKFIIKIDQSKLNSLENFIENLNSKNIFHEISHDYTKLFPQAFFGASIKLHDPSQLQELKDMEAVQDIIPVDILKPIKPLATYAITKPLLTATNSNQYAPLLQTKVSNLHAKGIFGQGIKVAFIDSGVDCQHIALGNGFGPGHKIQFGYDLVGDEFDGTNQPIPSKSPCTQCGVHGTHVTGIVGADDVGFGFQGVAPNATLGMYRVLGCQPDSGTRNEIVISAILMAIRDGAHVISASIGNVGGWSKGDSLSDLVDSIVAERATLILPAGNEGNEGLFFSESPAAAKNSLSVGSVQSKSTIISQFLTSNGKNITYFTSNLFNGSNFKLFSTSSDLNVFNDACNPLSETIPNLSNYIVLIKRGNCTFVTKTRNAISKGAKRILFYMNSDEMITLPNFIESSQVATISKIDGQWLINQIKINKNFTLNFPSNLHSFVDSPLGGFVSNFSQYGPSNDLLNLQPNFLAVGGDIISTVPRNLGNFSSMSGTSMSTPQLAGIAALVKSVRGKNLGTLKLKRILSTTAQQVHTAPGEKDVETVVHQGGGLVDAYCAAMSQSVLSTDSLSLNDIPNFKSKHTFDIVNEGNRAYTFKVGHIPAATVPTFTLNSTRAAPHVVALPGSPKAAVKIDQPMFFLGPKATQTIQVTFQAPSGIDPRLLAVYSGYISVVSDDGECEKHTLPYYGIAGSMKNQKIFDLGGDVDEFKNFKLPRLTDEARQPRPDGVFKFENGGEVVVRYRLAFGSQYVRTDLVPGNATLPPPIGSHHEVFKSPVEIPSNFTFSKKVFRGVPVLWMLPDSNSTYVGRTGMSDTIVVHWNGIGVPLKNAAKYVPVPSGSYKILIRGLRNRGNPYDDDDYDFWLSPKITIARSAEPKLAHRTNSSEAKPIQS